MALERSEFRVYQRVRALNLEMLAAGPKAISASANR